MKSKILIFVTIIFVTIFIYSCEKEENNLLNNDCSNMLYFTDVNELINELLNVLPLSTEEKIKWEQQKGFKSFLVSSLPCTHATHRKLQILVGSINIDNGFSKGRISLKFILPFLLIILK